MKKVGDWVARVKSLKNRKIEKKKRKKSSFWGEGQLVRIIEREYIEHQARESQKAKREDSNDSFLWTIRQVFF